MFNYTKAELSEIAGKENFIRDTLEKIVRLSEVLDYINSNPVMKGCLALKGGTAINLTVFHLPGLSVDIDLDSFVFTYVNLGGMRDNIKVEINYSLRSHLFEPEEKPVLSDVIHMEHLLTVLQPVELFAAKINALLSRAAARDLYNR